MEAEKVDLFLMTNGKYFEGQHIEIIRNRLLEISDSNWILLQSLQLKDPTTMLIVSFLGGQLGIDRFMIGDMGIGIAKLLTCGGLGVWTIIDLFLISNATRDRNLLKLQEVLDRS